MNKNSKIWKTTRSGHRVHSFEDGGALCRRSIAPGVGEFLTGPQARTWVLQTPCLSFCTACERQFNLREQNIEGEHAIALVMNEEFDAKATPSCVCPRMEPPAKYGHHVVCPLRATSACICPPSYAANDHHETPCPLYVDIDSKENDDVTIKEGPLTERQTRILVHLREGKRHEEIARYLSTVDETTTVNVVKQECQHIRSKFRTHTVTQAVSLWATAQAYRETATLIGSHRPAHVDSEPDVHVDHVLYGLMQILRERADRLTPR